jgi:hypothetical protein
MTDLRKFTLEIIQHSDGHGETFDLVGQLRTLADDSRDLNDDVANIVLSRLESLAEGWREQARKYHAHSLGKASED